MKQKLHLIFSPKILSYGPEPLFYLPANVVGASTYWGFWARLEWMKLHFGSICWALEGRAPRRTPRLSQ